MQKQTEGALEGHYADGLGHTNPSDTCRCQQAHGPVTSQKLHRVLRAAGLSKAEGGASGRIRGLYTTYHAGYQLDVEKDTTYYCARCSQKDGHAEFCYRAKGKPRWRQRSTPTGRIHVSWTGRTFSRTDDTDEARQVLETARAAAVAAGMPVEDTDDGFWVGEAK